jgi:hypothetical protein
VPKISELPSATTFTGSDLVGIVQGGVTKKIQASNFAASSLESAVQSLSEAASSVWRDIPVSGFSASPLSSSTLSATSTAIKAGLPIRYVVNGITLFGIVTAYSGGTVTVAGPLIDLAHPITSLAVAGADRVKTVDLFIAGAYAATTGDKLASVGNRYVRWNMGEARAVTFAAAHGTAASPTQPKLNIKIGGSLISSADGNAGLTMSGSVGTWVLNPVATMNIVNYDIAFGDDIEVNVSSAGSANAANLSVSIVFVLV